MRLLFDQNAPWPLRHHLPEHECTNAHQAGWAELGNGKLIAAAEAAGFDVLMTLDTNIRYQQNLADRKIGIVILPEQKLDVLIAGIDKVKGAIDQAGQGAYVEFDLPRPRLVRRPPPAQER